MATFETTLELSIPAHQAYQFFIRPQNLLELNPPEVQFTLIEAPEFVALGTRVTFEVSAMGFTQRSVHEITAFEQPNRFVEQQIEGPLRQWVHEHHFEPIADDLVRISDSIEFLPPGGMAGFLMNEDRIRGGLEKLFRFREKQLRRILESDA